jgi:outer membrane protein assembly factor BamB
MKRLALIVLVLVLLSAPAFAADWTQAKADAQHTSQAGEALQPPLKVDWTRDMGGSVFSSPIVSNGTVYAVDYENGKLFALSESTGGQLWQFQSQGGTIESTPIFSNGSIFVGSDDGYVYKVNAASGQMTWRSNVKSGMYSSPLVYSGRVYIGTNGGDFYALDEGTGSVVWTLNNVTQSSPAAWDGKVYVGTYGYLKSSSVTAAGTTQPYVEHGVFYALDASTGNVTWSYDCEDSIHSSPAIYNGTVYVASHAGTLYAFDARTGSVKWSYDLGYATDSSPSIDADMGAVYIGTYGGYMFALDAGNGDLRWVSAFFGPIYSTAAVSDGVIYDVSQDGSLFALSAADGSSLWTYNTGDSEVFASPAIADGRLFIGTTAGQLIALSPTSVSTTPAPSAAAQSKAAATPFLGLAACLAALGAAAMLKREL